MNLTYIIILIVIAIVLIVIVARSIGRWVDKENDLEKQKREEHLLLRTALEQKSAATVLEEKLRACDAATSFQQKLDTYTGALDYMHASKNSNKFSAETAIRAVKAEGELKCELKMLVTEHVANLVVAAPISRVAFDDLCTLMAASRKEHNTGNGYYARTWGVRYDLDKLAPPASWKDLVHQYYLTPLFYLYYYDDPIPDNQATLWAAEALRKNDPVQAKFLLALSKFRNNTSTGYAAVELGEVTCLRLGMIVEQDHDLRSRASTDQITQN